MKIKKEFSFLLIESHILLMFTGIINANVTSAYFDLRTPYVATKYNIAKISVWYFIISRFPTPVF